MIYLLIGLILFILFTLLIILLVSASYRSWLKAMKKDKNINENMLKITEEDMFFNYLKDISSKFNSTKTMIKNKAVNGENNKFLLFKFFHTFKVVFLRINQFLQNVFTKLKPVKNNFQLDVKRPASHNNINLYEDDEYFENDFHEHLLDEPNIVLSNNHKAKSSRLKPLKQAQIENNLTKEEYNKLESILIYKFGKETGANKFKIALELANLYGQVGNKQEQKELYKWVLEKGNEASKKIASENLIALN